MSIEAISGVDGGTTAGTTTRTGSALGRDQFLNLLLVQMQMQDPFEPMKNEDMIAQLAQFSSLEQLQNMNEGLQSNLEVDLQLGQLLSNTMATTLIGKEVRVATDGFERAAAKPVTLGYRLPADAARVSVTIRDAAGNQVATLDGKETGPGVHTLEWDGHDSKGNELPAGHYTFEVTATRADGSSLDTDTLLVGRVSGIRYKDGSARVLLGDTEILMSEIEEILA